MKKLKFLKVFCSIQSNPDKMVNGWILKNKNELTSYQFITAYSELGGGDSIGDDIALAYTTKTNKPISSSKGTKHNK